MTSVVRELRVTYEPNRQRGARAQVRTPSDAARLVTARLEQEAVEVALLLLVDAKHKVIALHELGRGTIDQCVVHVRDVFKVALLANATGVIVAHNHPSGDPTPSPDDMALCTRLRTAGALLAIDVHDFLVIGEGRYFSFKEAGRV